MSAVLAFTDAGSGSAEAQRLAPAPASLREVTVSQADPGDEHVAFPASIPADQVMDEAAISELLFERNHRRDTQQGCCDLCGRWDSNLQDGVGICCAEQLQRAEITTPKPMLPNAQHLLDKLKCAIAVVIELNDIRCPVEGIEIAHSGLCTIRLARSPVPGFVGNQHQLVRTTIGGGKQHITRASFYGCTLEWRNA